MKRLPVSYGHVDRELFFDPIEVDLTPIKNTKASKKNKFQIKQNQVTTINYRLKSIKPLNDTQSETFASYYDGNNICLTGFAGTGKTFLASYLAMKDVLHNHKYSKVVFIRSLVETRRIGFLPGSDKEKARVYEAPYYSIFSELFERDCYETFKNKGLVEFISTSFLRGQTLNDCVIIVDEVQNMTYHEIATIITRVGKNVKLILCGDVKQNDLENSKEKSGLRDILKVLRSMNGIDVIDFKADDIVRSDFVKDFLIAEDKVLSN